MFSDQSRQKLARPFTALTVLLAVLTHSTMLPAGALELSRTQPASAPSSYARVTPTQHSRGGAKRNSTATFEQAFTSAFLQQNAAAALDLFYWHGVHSQSRNVIVQLIQRDLSARLVETAWLPPKQARSDVSPPKGTLRANLETVFHFAARFVNPDGREHVSVNAVGTKNGRYFIALVEANNQARSI